MKYQTKPQPIEAIQFTGENFVEVMAWLKEQSITKWSIGPLGMTVQAGADPVLLNEGDWVIFHNRAIVMTDDGFKKAYEVAA